MHVFMCVCVCVCVCVRARAWYCSKSVTVQGDIALAPIIDVHACVSESAWVIVGICTRVFVRLSSPAVSLSLFSLSLLRFACYARLSLLPSFTLCPRAIPDLPLYHYTLTIQTEHNASLRKLPQT